MSGAFFCAAPPRHGERNGAKRSAVEPRGVESQPRHVIAKWPLHRPGAKPILLGRYRGHYTSLAHTDPGSTLTEWGVSLKQK